MEMPFTAVYVEGDDGWIVVLVEEFQGVVTQGKTIEEARERVIEGVGLIIEAHRQMVEEGVTGRRVLLRETLTANADDAN